MTTWFTSDLHWGHKNICAGTSTWGPGHATRPFRNPHHMNSVLRKNWCARVAAQDTVYVLGDWAFGTFEQGKYYTTQLPGRKILIKGNHDRSTKRMLEMGFDEVYNQYFLGDVLLYHLPPPTRLPELLRGTAPLWGGRQLHGHTHSTSKITSRGSVCVCPEAWDYAPARLDEVLHALRRSMRGETKQDEGEAR